MADFGIGETIAATTAAEAGAKGAETAGALGGADLLAPAAAEGFGLGGEAALGFAEGGLGGAEGIFSSVGDLAAGAGEGIAPSAVGAADPFATTIGAGGIPTPAGVGASAFAPAPGVELPSGIAADATSASAFEPLSFADRALPAEQAGQSGVFSGFEIPESPPGSGAGAASFAPPDTATPPAPFNATPGVPSATVPTPTADGGVTSSLGGGQPLDITTNPVPAATAGTPLDITPKAAGADTNILGKIGQGAVDSVTKNPLGLALGAGGLGVSLMNANKQSQAVKNVQNQAGKQSQTADQLANYALTGTVPAGSQAAIDKSIAEAKANAVSNAAGQGLPTDPTKNTALAATLAKIDAQGPILAAQIAQGLLQSGATYAGLSDQLYTQLAQIDQSQRAAMGKAIANFAAALNTGGGTKIQIGGTSA